LWQYADEWFREPKKYLCPEKTLYLKVEEKDGFLSFPSLLWKSENQILRKQNF
jgi:hypothetical protein